MSRPYRYYKSCVDFNGASPADQEKLSALIDEAIRISRYTFIRHVNAADLAELERQLGYERHHSRGLVMASDGCVSYHRGWFGRRLCYFVSQSAIEYLFLVPEGREVAGEPQAGWKTRPFPEMA